MPEDHLIPNTTQVPNSILDLLMPFLHDGEARILMYLCRRIYGFQREHDSVSLDQFVNGIRSGDRQIDFGAGISRQGAMNALAVLKAIGIVEQIEGGRGRGNIPVFKINRKCEMVQWLDLIAQEPKSARDKIVQRLDLIRKKSLPYGPFHRKPAVDAEQGKKVESVDLLEKVKSTTEKGLTVRPTKPSNTKPRKTKPPVNAKALTSPMGDEVRQRGFRLPKDWRPTEADMAWATRKGYHTLLDLAEVTEQFCKYWWSRAKDATKLDWSMTWQNRVTDLAKIEIDRRSRASPTRYGQRDTSPEAMERERKALEEIDKKGGGW